MYDYFQIVDGENLDGPERARACKAKTPPTIVSNGNAITLHIGQNTTYPIDTLFGIDFVAHYTVLDNGEYRSLFGKCRRHNY